MFSAPAVPCLQGAAATALDTAVPAQEQAKSALRTECAVFLKHRGPETLAPKPVLLFGNHPGRLPAALVRALAEDTGLPWVESTVGPGFSVDQILSRLTRQSPRCREEGPLGMALLGGLQHLSAEAAHQLASHLAATDRSPHLHQGRRLGLSPQQVFWVGSMQVREPRRAGPKLEPGTCGPSCALLMGGLAFTDAVAGGVRGQARAAGQEAEQAASFAALGRIFKATALLLPGTREDLLAWARAETAVWWPGRRLRAFCRQHGVDLFLGDGAAEALAAEAGELGGTVDAMEDRLRLAMEPVLAALADPTREFSAVEITPASLAHSEAPRLVIGPRRPPPEGTTDAGPLRPVESGIDRPPRTPQSFPDVRLARADDLAGVLVAEPGPALP